MSICQAKIPPRNSNLQCVGILKKVGMCSEPGKGNFNFISFIKQQNIVESVALSVFYKITGKIMRTAMSRQRYFKDYVCYYIINGIYIIMAFHRQFQVFFELVDKIKIKHRLRTEYFFQLFFRSRFCFFRLKTVPFNLFFTVHNLTCFLQGRHSCGIEGFFLRLGMVTAGGGRFC